GQGVDEEVGSGAGADTDDALVLQLRQQNVHCGLGNGLLEFVLGHAGYLCMLKNRGLYDPARLPCSRRKADSFRLASFPLPAKPDAMPTHESYVKKILGSPVYDVVVEAPVHRANFLFERLGQTVLLKREDLQPVFSVKMRGAYNKLARLTDEQRACGVIAASAGNHAQGLAFAARHMGVKATIVMPRTTPEIKVKAVRARGGKVVL